GGGLGGLALSWLLARDGHAGVPAPANPLAARPSHFPAPADAGLFLFMGGGPRQVGLFDPQPEPAPRPGQPLPGRVGPPVQRVPRGRPRGCGPARPRAPATVGPGWKCPTCCRTWPPALTISPSSAPAGAPARSTPRQCTSCTVAARSWATRASAPG